MFQRLIPGLLLIAALPLSAAAATVKDVLAKMDQHAASFTSMSANLKKLTHTEVIDDNSEESGTMLLKRIKAKELAALVNFAKPDPRTIALRGNKAEIYYPKTKLVNEYNLSKYKDLVDQFMLVGFGTSGKDLLAKYDVKLGAEETVAGTHAYRLDCTPKTAESREKLKQLQLWIVDDGSHPVQQKFAQPSGDYTMFTYTDVKLNVPLSDDALRLKLPPDVKREFPQK